MGLYTPLLCQPSRCRWACTLLCALTCVALMGCSRNSKDTSSVVSIKPEKVEEALPVFNQDLHVIKALWTELQALESVDNSDDTAAKKAALQQALKNGLDALKNSSHFLTESDRELVDRIKRGLK